MIDPVQALVRTTGVLLPTGTPTHVPPVPTVVPDTPELQYVGDSGQTALWVVFALMTIASAAFAGLALRVPVVSSDRLWCPAH